MGDRVLYVVTGKEKPQGYAAIYSHWGGYNALETLEKAGPTMRAGDVSYATARLCAAVCEATGDPLLSAGILPPPTLTDVSEEFRSFSHGDAGVIVIDVDTGEYRGYAGYHAGKTGKITLGRG